jgi:hypothetical protein
METKNHEKILLITGIFGILSFLMVALNTMLYFVYPETPPIWNVLLRVLIGSIMLIFLLIFFSGFQQIVRNYSKNFDWIATLIFSSACMFLTISLVAKSLEAGAVFNPEGIAVDATQDGELAQGNYLLYGSIARLITAVFMLSIGYVTSKTNILPIWTGVLAYLIGLVNIAFIPSMFFGRDAGKFYSAIGWGNSALTAGLFSYWVLIASIIFLRKVSSIKNKL